MKIFLIDTDFGLVEVLPENELLETFTKEELNEIKANPENIVRELPYTLKQYNKAVKLRSNSKWCEDFEDEYMYSPSVKDILEHLYN